MPKHTLTQSRLKELLHYDLEYGVFTWKKPNKRIKVGSIAGSLKTKGYRQIQINGKHYRASRLAWLYVEGYFPENDVDHRNRIRDDNRWDNLRHVSSQCNNRNRGIQKNNSSGVAGIFWNKQKSKWRAQIVLNKKQLYLGYFDTKTEAAQARWEAEKKHNFPNCNSTSSAYLYLKERGLA